MNRTTFIDTHCHLDFSVFDDQRDVILQTCQKQQLSSVVIPGVCSEHWQRVLLLCQQQSMLYPALGLHPCFLDKHQESDLQQLEQLCTTKPIKAIGEIGLDYYYNNKLEENNNRLDKDKQHWYFSQQLKIAKKYHLPVLIHARRSHHDVIQQLKKLQPLKGIIHAYSGSYEQAKEYLKLGFKLGFGGAYTYPKATKLRQLVVRLPLTSWVFETDAPDMSPVAHHGQMNSPVYLPEIAGEFIRLYDASDHSTLGHQQILAQIYKNSQEILSLN